MPGVDFLSFFKSFLTKHCMKPIHFPYHIADEDSPKYQVISNIFPNMKTYSPSAELRGKGWSRRCYPFFRVRE